MTTEPTLERTLDIIDAGLQGVTERAEAVGAGCVRCTSAKVEGGDLCGPCRAFLLEDSDVDPAADRPRGGDLAEALRGIGDEISVALARVVEERNLGERAPAAGSRCTSGAAPPSRAGADASDRLCPSAPPLSLPVLRWRRTDG